MRIAGSYLDLLLSNKLSIFLQLIELCRTISDNKKVSRDFVTPNCLRNSVSY